MNPDNFMGRISQPYLAGCKIKEVKSGRYEIGLIHLSLLSVAL